MSTRSSPALAAVCVVLSALLAAQAALAAAPSGEAMPSVAAPAGTRAWDGHNPFHQPAATSDYYGSGDADLDGEVTAADVEEALRMANGARTPSIRADVDGSGAVDAVDVDLIETAAAGVTTLPAWWNHLASRTAREAWVDRVLALDATDQHPHTYWWQCSDFAVQLYVRGALYRGELFHTQYDGGPTVFNLPVYAVSIIGQDPPFGHGISAILVGDDPLAFQDWRFIEPQSDTSLAPGATNMPFGTDVRIRVPAELYRSGYAYADTLVTFHLDPTGPLTTQHSPNLVLSRPDPQPVSVDNAADLWNPRVLPTSGGSLLFERVRDDLSRAVDIHVAGLPITSTREGAALVGGSGYSRLLDAQMAGPDAVDLLWTAKPDATPAVFHGVLQPSAGTLNDIARASEGVRMVRMGRVIRAQNGDIHVFWLEDKHNASHPYVTGVYWSRRTGSDWTAAQNLTPFMDEHLADATGWITRDVLRYLFDVVALDNGDLLLVWATGATGEGALYARRYDGSWAPTDTIEGSGGSLGVAVAAGPSGSARLVYWRDSGGLRGDLLVRTLDGAGWSSPGVLDDSAQACCPRVASGAQAELYAVWERTVGGLATPLWARELPGHWFVAGPLSLDDQREAWYPTGGVLPDGRLLVACSARDADHVGVATWYVSVHRLHVPVVMK